MPDSDYGTVYLVGAGPGHPGLITRWGAELLEQCNAVVYDDLIPDELIVGLNDSIEKHYVGKRAGRHSVPQPEINRMLFELAQRYESIVRLKGGDPSIFGRSGEELSYLMEHGVHVIVIPGVTAASAAAAWSGFSLTDRRQASWALLATGHKAVSDSPQIPWTKFGELAGGTFVVYMGIGELEQIVCGLLKGGLAPNTPCLVIEKASTARQKIVQGSLDTIHGLCRESEVAPPALIVIGEVVGNRIVPSVSEKLPLLGKSVLVTRPSRQNAYMRIALRELGAEPIPYPTVTLASVVDGAGWTRFKEMTTTGGWIAFTNEAGVREFFRAALRQGLDHRCLGRFRIAAVGYGTLDALRSSGFNPDFVPEKTQVRELAVGLAEGIGVGGKIVVRVRGNLGDEAVEDTLWQCGADVLPLTVYHNRTAAWEPHWLRRLEDAPPDFITFTSGSTADSFIEIVGERNARKIAQKSRIVSIGPTTSKTIRKYGIDVDMEAEIHSVEGLIEALASSLKS